MRSSDIDLLGLFPAFTWQKIGGVETSARVAWRGIVNCGLRSAYLFCFGSKGEAPDDDSGGQTVYAASKVGSVIAALGTRWPVRLVLVWHLGLLKLLPFFRIPDARVVLFLHGIEAWRPQSWMTRTLLRRVALYLSNSDHTWQRFLSFNPHLRDAPHRTVHLGIGSPIATAVPVPAHPPAILMLGRLLRGENYKGHREMIEAWPLVQRRIPDAQLWIAGDGDLRQDLEEMVRAGGLDGRIRFWGQVSEEEKQSLLARARCLALPSRAEGFGLVYLEGVRMGRPCLVSTADAGREVVNPPEAGLAADPSDLQQVAEAVCRLLTLGPEWDRWSLQARRRYERHFTAVQFQQRLVTALLES
jgi:phosphatidylinositol alpha-1,6-mannosyltransferase